MPEPGKVYTRSGLGTLTLPMNARVERSKGYSAAA